MRLRAQTPTHDQASDQHLRTALVTVSHRVPLIGLLIGGVFAWLAFWLRSHPMTTIELLNRIVFWTLLVIAACFVVLGVAGFIETISARRRRDTH